MDEFENDSLGYFESRPITIDNAIRSVELVGYTVTDKEAINCLQTALFSLHMAKLALTTEKEAPVLPDAVDEQFKIAMSGLDDFLAQDADKKDIELGLTLIGRSIGTIANNPDRINHLVTLLNYRMKLLKRLHETY